MPLYKVTLQHPSEEYFVVANSESDAINSAEDNSDNDDFTSTTAKPITSMKQVSGDDRHEQIIDGVGIDALVDISVEDFFELKKALA